MTALLAFLKSGVAVLTNPAALLLIATAYVAGNFKGGHKASSKCQTAALEARIQSMTADKTAAENAAKRFEVEAKTNADQAAKNAAIVEEMRNAQTPACRLSDVDVRRLRNIR